MTPDRLFAALAAVFGLAFVLVTPPYDAPDEHRHFGHAFLVAEGRLAPRAAGPGGEARVPASLLRLHPRLAWQKPARPCRHDLAGISALAAIPLDPAQRVALDTRTPYTPLAYLPYALPIALGRALGLPPVHLLRLARIGGLVAWCVLVGLAIRVAPVGKWVFVVLGLLPTAVFHGSSVSADGVTLGVAYLFLAVALHLALSPDIRVTRRESAWLLSLGAALACVKPGYAPLALAVLAIPADRFPTPRARRMLWVAVAAAVILPGAVWAGWVVAVAEGPPVPGADPARQLAIVAGDPLAMAGRVVESWQRFGRQYVLTFVGILGILDVMFPWPLYVGYGVGLLAVALADDPRSALGTRARVGLVSLFAVNTVLLMTLVYVAWNPPGDPVVRGFGGRYLLPIAPLLLLALPPQPRVPAPSPLVVGLLTSLGLVAALSALAHRYYGAG